MGEKKNAAPAQISLGWLLAQKPFIVPIPGTTQMAHMLENTGASQINFTSRELEDFNKELDVIKILGERLPAGVLAFSDVEAPEKKK
ncbi:aldo/keto reductase [Flavobacterium sp. N2469]|uniref:aldo/keto reductase n=1 Tax=Flavobacterium sp. N2469 TaxID=2986832 RepID=UPI0022234ADA|nr:aldo/keto reductase [Flavobacterium sp. N2469]